MKCLYLGCSLIHGTALTKAETAHAGQINCHGQDIFGTESGIDGANAHKAFKHQTGARPNRIPVNVARPKVSTSTHPSIWLSSTRGTLPFGARASHAGPPKPAKQTRT